MEVTCMKKADLISGVAKATVTKQEAAMAINVFLNMIKAALKKREEVFISGFGTFTAVKRKARKGRNPRTGEEVKVAARFMTKFKAAKALKEAVR